MTEPEPTYKFLEDGSVEVTYGTEKGWVSSAHLIEPKVNQLKASYYVS